MSLRIYPVAIEVIVALRGPTARIERRDRDLGRQLRRAGSSVVLNIAEGMYSRGALRQARFHTALGSAREVLACLEAAEAWDYLPEIDARVTAKLNQVIGTLVRLI